MQPDGMEKNLVPSDQLPVTCPHANCPKTFRYTAWMRKHRVIHQGSAQLPCGLDHKRFKSKDIR